MTQYEKAVLAAVSNGLRTHMSLAYVLDLHDGDVLSRALQSLRRRGVIEWTRKDGWRRASL